MLLATSYSPPQIIYFLLKILPEQIWMDSSFLEGMAAIPLQSQLTTREGLLIYPQLVTISTNSFLSSVKVAEAFPCGIQVRQCLLPTYPCGKRTF